MRRRSTRATVAFGSGIDLSHLEDGAMMLMALSILSYAEVPLIVFLSLIAGVALFIFRSPNISSPEERKTFCAHVSVWHPTLFETLEKEWETFLWMYQLIRLFEEAHGKYDGVAQKQDTNAFMSARECLPPHGLMERMRDCLQRQRQSYLHARAQFERHVPWYSRAWFEAAFPPDHMCE